MTTQKPQATPPAMPTPTDTMAEVIERIVLDPAIPIDRLEQMLAMKNRLDEKAAKMAYASAFAKMQAALPVIPERGAITNRAGEVQSTYPLWEDVNAGLRYPLAANGLSMSFDRRKVDGKIIIGCIVTHVMGHSERAEIDLPRDDSGSKNAVQGEGSTVSYGQRYSSKLLLNWVGEGSDDDDGQRAGGPQTISSEQFIAIRDMAEHAGVPDETLCTAYGAPSLEQFPRAAFDRAMKRLQATVAKRTQEPLDV